MAPLPYVLLIVMLGVASCGPKEQDTACPDRQGAECPIEYDNIYVCDACEKVWYCRYYGDTWESFESFWTGVGYGYCPCLTETGTWDYQVCPEED